VSAFLLCIDKSDRESAVTTLLGWRLAYAYATTLPLPDSSKRI
jgi:hypothetical protein